MSDTNRFLLAMQDKEGKKIVLEFESQEYLDGKKSAANGLDIWCDQINQADLLSEEYKNARHFQMDDPVTCKIFYLEQWTHILESKEGKVEDSVSS